MSPSRGPWRDAYRFGDSRDYQTDRRDYGEGSYSYGESRRSTTSGNGYGSFRRGHHTRPRYDHSHREGDYDNSSDRGYDYESRSHPPRRRGSPVYEDYAGPSASAPSSSQPSLSQGRDRSDYDRPYPNSYSYYELQQPPSKSRRSPSPESLVLLQPSLSARLSQPPGSPSRSPAPRRTEPSEQYLSTSLHPSTHISDPTSSRKLIVLDLNGSLLIRSTHQKRIFIPRHHQNHPQHSRSSQAHADPYAESNQLRGLRSVHPRPYLSSFISYLFHPETKKWLDTMVWSSAQPHSVDDMVQKCFKDRRSELKAVWARDTLGLSVDEYRKKTQTTKDLEKPWAELSSLLPPTGAGPGPAADAAQTSVTLTTDQEHPPQPPPTATTPSSEEPPTKSGPAPFSPSASDQPSQPTTSPDAEASIQRHSAKSTLLVDDSPLKAILQPWNHLCIKEYVQEMRRHDLEVVEWVRRERVRKASEDEKQKKVEEQEEEMGVALESSSADVSASASASAHAVDGELISQPQHPDGEGEKEEEVEGEEHKLNSHERRKLKRLAKKREGKKAKEEARSANIVEPAPTGVVANEADPPTLPAVDVGAELKEADAREYDPTLLAVIGILDHLKYEDNIAGWMRAGGLLTVPGVPLPDATSASSGKEDDLPGSIAAEKTRTVAATSTSPTVEAAEEGDKLHAASQISRDGRTPPVLEEQGREKRRRVSLDEDVTKDAGKEFEVGFEVGTQAPPPSGPVSTKDVNQELEQATTGIPTSNPEPPSAPTNSLKDEATSPSDLQVQPLWYDHPAVFAYWAQRGREALRQLGIEVESGIGRAPGGFQPSPSSSS